MWRKDKIETLEREIKYLNDRCYALQAEILHLRSDLLLLTQYFGVEFLDINKRVVMVKDDAKQVP